MSLESMSRAQELDKLDKFLAQAEKPPRKNPRLGVEFDHETMAKIETLKASLAGKGQKSRVIKRALEMYWLLAQRVLAGKGFQASTDVLRQMMGLDDL